MNTETEQEFSTVKLFRLHKKYYILWFLYQNAGNIKAFKTNSKVP
jgi:hypothetical protein